MIVFDEIGLADVSPHNPLRVLNRILDTNNLPVSFIGLTNWNLSVSKMSRMMYVARPDMTEDDLVTTANSILGIDLWKKELDFKPINSVEENKLKVMTENFNLKSGLYEYFFNLMATSYGKLTQIENFSGCSNFHGSRDFYTLIKDFSKQSELSISVSKDKSGVQTLEIEREDLIRHFLITIGRNFSGKELRSVNSSELIQEEV
jgi:E3 ubiquitin-protein ligase RNF213